MGWLYRKEIKGQRVKEAIADYITGGRGGLRPVVASGAPDIEIVRSQVGARVAYIAIRNLATLEIGAIVVLIGRDRKRGEIGFKVMSEGEGPYYYGCQDRILKILTPTQDPGALEWRSRCRAYNEKIARLRGDLTGKRINLWGATYTIEGRSYNRGRSWQGRHLGSGVLFTIRPKQLKEADLLD